jgi:hypothetical protein
MVLKNQQMLPQFLLNKRRPEFWAGQGLGVCGFGLWIGAIRSV